jgi:hypothetical protein
VIYKPTPNKEFLYQFIPDKYKYLLKTDKVEYKGLQLKTAYLVNIMHELILKYYFQKDEILEKELRFNIWSMLLKEKYGAHYNYYIDYLVEHKFMMMVSDYYRNQKARTYQLNLKSLQDVTKCKTTDKVLLKKHSQEYLKKTFLNYTNSPIPLDIREKLVNDLYKVKIDVDGAMTYLNDLRKELKIYHLKYQKNVMSVENLGINNIFFKFDEYGRMHTNFTVLKKEIRKNFITIDGLPTFELDITNSQPLFLIVLMKQKMPLSELIKPDVSRYIDLVKNGLIYEEIVEKCKVIDRDAAKIMMYKVLFGKNGHKRRENILFGRTFPTVYDFILKYKETAKDYRVLSHDLQLTESDFIFNKVIRHLMNSHPDMTIFTIHDSIDIPIKYKDEVTAIFNYYLRNLITL